MLAILCSGQGKQHPDMFALSGPVPEAAGLFAHAAALLGGHDPRELVHTAVPALLHSNHVAQILCALQALAAARALREALPDRLVVAGYSVGEVAAWGVGGLLDMSDVLDLVAHRASLMNADSGPDDGLLFVRGLSRDNINRLCQQHDCGVAIVNPADAFVLGGERHALNALAREAQVLNAARIVPLPVNVASHTPRLAHAASEFRALLSHYHPNLSQLTHARILSGVDGAPVLQAESGCNKLAAQISQTVQWADCLQGCIEAGATAFLELGPGAALSRIAAEAYPGIPARSLEEFKTLPGARGWIAKVSQ